MQLQSIGSVLFLTLSACTVTSEGTGELIMRDAALSASDGDSGSSGQDSDPPDAGVPKPDSGARDAGGPPMPCNGHVALCGRRFDEVAYASTHNSHAAQAYGYNALNASQISGLDKQLDDGVRGFLVDVYDYNGKHVLCHGPCQLTNTPHADWLNILKMFLDGHRREVVAIIYQDDLAADQIAKDFADAGLAPYLYTHVLGSEWPTLGAMIAANTRLVVTAENGRPPPLWFHHVWDEAWDTPYEFRNASQFSCELNRGTKGNSLFLVNHWVSGGIGSVFLPNENGAKQVNEYDVLYARAQQCKQEAGQLPNFIAVDFYEHGDLFKVVDKINGL